MKRLGRWLLCVLLGALLTGPPRHSDAQQTGGGAAPEPASQSAAAPGAAAAQPASTPQAPAADEEAKPLLPAVPLVGYTHETSLLLGVMMVRAHRWEDAAPGTKPNTIALSGFYTLQDQWGIGVAPAIYLRGEDYLIKPTFYFHRTPARFWGVGNEAGANGTREDFTATGTGLIFSVTKLVWGSLRLGPSLWWGSARVLDKEPGGLLASGALVGADGGRDVGAEVVAEWDSRDNIYAPRSGTYFLGSAGWHRPGLGSEFTYDDYVLDLRRFVALPRGQVLALQAKVRALSGDPPFYRLAALGGIGVLRGLYEGRFRDKALAALQAEYRLPIWRRLGAAVFAGVGEVAPSLQDFDTADLLYTGGVGLRLALDTKERINLRADLGISAYGLAPIVVITEAF